MPQNRMDYRPERRDHTKVTEDLEHSLLEFSLVSGGNYDVSRPSMGGRWVGRTRT